MSVSRTSVSVASRASVKCGIGPISSFDEGNESHYLFFQENYEEMVLENLGDYMWGFNTNEQLLTRQAASPPSNRWDAIYEEPPDTISIETVLINERPVNYDRFDNQIWVNASEDDVLHAVYQRRVLERFWRPYFVRVMVLDLCIGLAMTVQERPDSAQEWERQYKEAWIKAVSRDAQEQTAKGFHLKRFQAARRSHTRGDYTRADRWR